MNQKIFKKKKSLGQNFLKSKSAIRSIVTAGDLAPDDTVLEIGPGKGVLTEELLATGANVVAIEKDDRLISELNEKFADHIKNNKFTLIHGDILDTPIERIVGDKSYKVVANIPYYITGILFRKLLEKERQPTRMVVLVQKEVAERIVARDKRESILSLSVKAYGEPKVVEKVSKKMFSPQPKVDSAILLISNISKKFFDSISEESFFNVIRAGFSQKRKKVIRNLEQVIPIEKLKKVFGELKLDENMRAENLKLAEWKEVTSFIN